jgi:hypothetical protein
MKIIMRLSWIDHMEKTFECQFLFVLQAHINLPAGYLKVPPWQLAGLS